MYAPLALARRLKKSFFTSLLLFSVFCFILPSSCSAASKPEAQKKFAHISEEKMNEARALWGKPPKEYNMTDGRKENERREKALLNQIKDAKKRYGIEDDN